MTRPSWFPDWTGERAVIVASGPSAMDAPLSALKGKARVIATNDSWRLVPWADVLYASDAEWWATGAGDEFAGLKVSRSPWFGVRKVDLAGREGAWSNDLELDQLGVIGAGAGSGFQALNLAAQFGAKRIALVGFDARIDRGLHWHGAHGGGLKNPHEGTARLWADFLDMAAPVLAELGVAVVNCSLVSALSAYPVCALEDFLAMEAE